MLSLDGADKGGDPISYFVQVLLLDGFLHRWGDGCVSVGLAGIFEHAFLFIAK